MRISTSERRAIRRQIINELLHKGLQSVSMIKHAVRITEKFHYNAEMKVY